MNCLCIDGLTPLDILSPVFAACSWIKGMHGLMKGPGIQDLPILYIIHFTSDVFLINHKQPLSIAVTLVQVACLASLLSLGDARKTAIKQLQRQLPLHVHMMPIGMYHR